MCTGATGREVGGKRETFPSFFSWPHSFFLSFLFKFFFLFFNKYWYLFRNQIILGSRRHLVWKYFFFIYIFLTFTVIKNIKSYTISTNALSFCTLSIFRLFIYLFVYLQPFFMIWCSLYVCLVENQHCKEENEENN